MTLLTLIDAELAYGLTPLLDQASCTFNEGDRIGLIGRNGTGYFCDPWWGYCYVGVTSGDIITANKSDTKFGLNVGLGVEFPVGEESAWFIEARYHWVDSTKATEFIPIQIGFRF